MTPSAADPREPLGQARSLVAAGRLGEAEALVRQVLARHPGKPDATVILAEIALAARLPDDALGVTAGLVAAGEGECALHLARGRAFLLRGDLLDAAAAFRLAVDAPAPTAEAHWLLAETLRDLGRLPAARRTALAGLHAAPDSQRGRSLLFDILQREFRAGLRVPVGAAAASPAGLHPQPRISVIICSVNPEKFARVAANYRERLAGVPHEILLIDDARSLCEGYNRGIDRATGDILVFSHDDIEILTGDFAPRLIGHLEQVDLIGVAGTTRVVDATWGMAGWPHCHGQVVHADRTLGTCAVSMFQVTGPVVEDIQGLDGLFFAARRRVIESVRFDALTFDGFHLYDLDFTFSAFQAGFRITVCNDIVIAHDSRGRFDARFAGFAERFVAKHRASLSLQRGTVESVPEATFGSLVDANAFCSLWLACVGGQDLPGPQLPASGDFEPPAGLSWQYSPLDFAAEVRVRHYQANRAVAGLAPQTAVSVLAIGADAAGLAQALRARLPAARIHTASVDVDAADVGALLPGVTFDVIALEGVIERWVLPWPTLLALRTRMAAGSQLILGTANARNLTRLAAAAADDPRTAGQASHAPGPLRALRLIELRRGLAQAGWRIARIGAIMDPGLKAIAERHHTQRTGLEVSLGRLTLRELTVADITELCVDTFLVTATAAPG
jgi:hypothetical protein